MSNWNGRIITASAGTGKTKRLVTEYMRILQDFVKNNGAFDVNNILAITFTNKAANEMKERIRKNIEKKVKEEGGELWQSFRNKLGYAWISTIHSFCERILKENFVHLDIDPSFQVLTDVMQNVLIDRVVVGYVIENLKSMENLIKKFGLKDTVELFKSALSSKRYEALCFTASKFELYMDQDILNITEEFLKHFKSIYTLYEKAMMEKSKLDFDALLWKAYILLKENEDLRMRYTRKFKFILVDEFQDTNELQVEIIKLIHDPNLNSVFFVGDPKQSIYRFRGANVHVFTKLIDEFGEENVDYLDKTYRSCPSLVEFFNRFFSKAFKKYRMDYKPVKPDDEKFKPPYKIEKKVKIVIPHEVENNKFSEPTAIAKYIIHKVIKKEKKFRDFTVLLRKFKGLLYSYTYIFDRFGIPYHVVGGKGFYELSEINGLISFMEALNNPYNDAAFVSFLISPMFNLSLDEIARLKKADEHIYSALEKSSEPDLRMIYDIYTRFRKMKEITRISEILERIITETDYLPKLAVLKESRKKIMNVRKLIEISRDLEREGLSFREFIRFLTHFSTDEEGEAAVESEEDDVVRIITIHKSKGLEFDTVILSSIFKESFRNKQNFISDYDGGFILLLCDEKYENEFLEKLFDDEKNEEAREELRLLYVAMTRAKDELVLCGVPSKRSQGGTWKSLFSDLGFYDNGWNIPEEFSDTVEIVNEEDLGIPDEFAYKVKSQEGEPVKIVPSTVNRIEDMAKKTYISPTSIYDINMNFSDLEKSFMEQREKGLGLLAHEILKEVGNRRGDHTTKLRSLLHAKPVIVDKVRYDEDDFNEVWKYLKNWIDSEPIIEIENAEKVFSELAISKRFDDRILYGIIDKLYLKDGEWTVLDFKFSERRNDEIEKHKFQVMFYAYSLIELLGSKPRKARILYLKERPENGVLEFFFRDEDFTKFEQELRNKIMNYDEFIRRMGYDNVIST